VTGFGAGDAVSAAESQFFRTTLAFGSYPDRMDPYISARTCACGAAGGQGQPGTKQHPLPPLKRNRRTGPCRQ
jgi:hypothetical protein